MDIVQNGVRHLGLGVLLGLAGGGIDHDLAVLVLQGLAAVGVDDELQGLGVELAGSALTGGIGQRDTGVAADIVVEAQILGGLAHDLTVALGGDTGGLVLGIHHVQVESLSQLAGELGTGPTNQLALGLGLTGIGVDVVDDLAQSKHAGTNSFSHCFFLPIEIVFAYLFTLSKANRAAPNAPLYWVRGEVWISWPSSSCRALTTPWF